MKRCSLSTDIAQQSNAISSAGPENKWPLFGQASPLLFPERAKEVRNGITRDSCPRGEQLPGICSTVVLVPEG